MKLSMVRVFLLIAPLAASLRAQTIDDGLLMPRGALGTGSLYAHESWSQYWEGTLERNNGNIGTLTTQSITWMVGYGVTDRLSVMTLLPYVWTRASQGTLQGMHGVQDLTLAAKYRLLSTPFTGRGTLRAMVVGAAGIPASNYVPDFLPLSIGLASRRFAGRFTLNFQAYAGCGRLHGDSGIRAGTPLHPDLAFAATDAGRWRHSPAGHALRLKPDGLGESRRAGDLHTAGAAGAEHPPGRESDRQRA